MTTRNRLLPTLVFLFLASAAPSLAQQNIAPAAPEQEIGSKQPSPTELKSFESAPISIAQAIAAAEKRPGGGKAIDVSFDEGNGRPVFNAKTYQNNSVWEGAVDAKSGQLIGPGKTTPESALDQEDKAELAGLQQAKVTLAAAVKTAESAGSGKSMSAGLEETNGKIVYEVVVVKNGSAKKLTIDPVTGKIAP